jgi:molybdenum cofactor cytidylyltransferase
MAVVVAGLSALGKPLDEEHVHRAGTMVDQLGLEAGRTVTGELMAGALLHPQGGLKLPGLRKGAKRAALLNQADDDAHKAAGGKLAESLLAGYDAALVAQLEVETVWSRHEHIAGVVLAAGGSTRCEATKQVVPWRGKPFVRAVAETALAAGCAPVVVVTGYEAEAVEAALDGLNVIIVRNSAWEAGQSSSMRAGIEALPAFSGGALFFLADQPQIPPALPRALIEAHRTGEAQIIAPLADGRRANPVLFDASLFTELMAVEGDQGGRALFSKYSPQYLEWVDAVVALDVDTAADYARLLNYEDE